MKFSFSWYFFWQSVQLILCWCFFFLSLWKISTYWFISVLKLVWLLGPLVLCFLVTWLNWSDFVFVFLCLVYWSLFSDYLFNYFLAAVCLFVIYLVCNLCSLFNIYCFYLFSIRFFVHLLNSLFLLYLCLLSFVLWRRASSGVSCLLFYLSFLSVWLFAYLLVSLLYSSASWTGIFLLLWLLLPALERMNKIINWFHLSFCPYLVSCFFSFLQFKVGSNYICSWRVVTYCK